MMLRQRSSEDRVSGRPIRKRPPALWPKSPNSDASLRSSEKELSRPTIHRYHRLHPAMSINLPAAGLRQGTYPFLRDIKHR